MKTPIQVLKKHKKSIDIYIERMKKLGYQGSEFYEGYKKYQKTFEKAIKILNEAERN